MPRRIEDSDDEEEEPITINDAGIASNGRPCRAAAAAATQRLSEMKEAAYLHESGTSQSQPTKTPMNRRRSDASDDDNNSEDADEQSREQRQSGKKRKRAKASSSSSSSASYVSARQSTGRSQRLAGTREAERARSLDQIRRARSGKSALDALSSSDDGRGEDGEDDDGDDGGFFGRATSSSSSSSSSHLVKKNPTFSLGYSTAPSPPPLSSYRHGSGGGGGSRSGGASFFRKDTLADAGGGDDYYDDDDAGFIVDSDEEREAAAQGAEARRRDKVRRPLSPWPLSRPPRHPVSALMHAHTRAHLNSCIHSLTHHPSCNRWCEGAPPRAAREGAAAARARGAAPRGSGTRAARGAPIVAQGGCYI